VSNIELSDTDLRFLGMMQYDPSLVIVEYEIRKDLEQVRYSFIDGEPVHFDTVLEFFAYGFIEPGGVRGLDNGANAPVYRLSEAGKGHKIED
jgi:hypothetical protein